MSNFSSMGLFHVVSMMLSVLVAFPSSKLIVVTIFSTMVCAAFLGSFDPKNILCPKVSFFDILIFGFLNFLR